MDVPKRRRHHSKILIYIKRKKSFYNTEVNADLLLYKKVTSGKRGKDLHPYEYGFTRLLE